MKQYREIKDRHPGAILFFRVGDFYEMFFEDAVTASKILEIALTSRDKSKAEPIPLCGIPYHAASAYIARLIKSGRSVAICDQVEEASQAKGLVRREVVRVITPGTLIEPELLSPKENHYFASVYLGAQGSGLAFVDLSTGEFRVSQFNGSQNRQELWSELERLEAKEVLVGENALFRLDETSQGQTFPFHFCRFDDSAFDPEVSRQTLLDHFETQSLAGFGVETLPLAVSAAGALLKYLQETQRRSLAHIRPLRLSSLDKHLVIDAITQKNLELTRRLRDQQLEGSLLWTLDHTRTAMGGRLLRNWLLRPLRNISEIQDRLDTVGDFHDETTLRTRLRDHLEKVGDLERLIGRISLGTATGRDLLQLKVSLLLLPLLYKCLEERRSTQSQPLPSFIEELWKTWDNLTDIHTIIDQTLVDDPPPGTHEGGLIRTGIDPNLDELRTIARDGKQWISNLEAKEREKTGIETLKIRYNQVFGYYIEITKARLGKVPPEYHRKQTLVNAERFITPELKDFEGKVLGAEDKSRKMESELFVKLRTRIAGETRRVQSMGETLAKLDTLLSLAESAATGNFIKPEIHDGFELEITAGRHPMLERTLPHSARFVPNDTRLDGEENRLMIITGPNMAGKSTYMRQVALTALMAQMGSFVPATKARIGLVDRIFTRVGASDDLMGGQSTFMVEMTETASILNQSTNKSLILLDEIGRGTSTFDGLSIAWAVAEFLQDPERSGARTLFATHYHQLTELALTCPGIQNYNIAVREWNDRIIFLHKIVPGGTDRSYGIQVARLAGIPGEVIRRAREILANLEKGELTESGRPRLATRSARSGTNPEESQISLFSNQTHPILKELRDINISEMTPIEALNCLNDLKKKADG